MATLALSPIGHELLDDPGADPAIVTESFRNLARSNWWFGGAAAVHFGLGQLVSRGTRGTALTLLDLGTGVGDLPRSAAAWAARRGVRLSGIGFERSRVAAALARQGGLPSVVGCAGALPFRARSADIVMMSQLIHHLSRDAAVEVIRSAHRIARVGVVLADLRRSAVAAFGFRIGSGLLRFDPITRADGVTSVRRGYLPHELSAILHDAGVTTAVHTRPGFRLVAAWRAN
jgi:2-polyprenyl-3-methyl-5-hydroxy-6-metoxy-1,4-benzoquinol methylase